jgi:hypothetical protein
MKKKILIGIGILLVVIIAFLTWYLKNTKKYSPVARATYSNNGVDINIVYCKPYKKGRLIFGDESAGALQPYGKYWRLGANEATTFEVNKDILFGDKELKAGKYQIYAVPGKENWEVCLNSDWDKWGAMEADHNKDVLRTQVGVDNEATPEEQLLISFEDLPENPTITNMIIHWDQAMVKVPITAKTASSTFE